MRRSVIRQFVREPVFLSLFEADFAPYKLTGIITDACSADYQSHARVVSRMARVKKVWKSLDLRACEKKSVNLDLL